MRTRRRDAPSTPPEEGPPARASQLARVFPGLATPEGQIGELPSESSAFVGRAAELAQLVEQLRGGSIRLVTLTGPGGIGKTRLALRAAADVQASFQDGATFVDLSAARDTPSVLLAMARESSIADRSEREQLDELVTRLRERHRLMVLDNFEQVTSAAPAIATMLQECPGLKMLVTSRQRLNVRGEQVVPLQPLGLPARTLESSSVERLEAFESIQLFVLRARAVRPDFRLTDDNAAAVAEICRRLDGLPLAIELATARIGIFSPQAMLQRLSSRLDLLRGGAQDLPERQRTLRGTIEWSHELLTVEEQRLFALLAAFAGAGFETLESVVNGIDGALDSLDLIDRLSSLVNKNLVRQRELDDGGIRFSMLETIREYADERLRADPGFSADVRRAHARHFVEVATSQAGRLAGDGREEALSAITLERENLDAAWRHLRGEGDREQLEVLLDALWPIYEAKGWYRAIIELASDMLSVLEAEPASSDRDAALVTLRTSLARALLAMQGYTPEVEEAYARTVELFGRDQVAPQLFPVLRGLASFYIYRAEFDKAVDMGRRILALGEAEDDHSMRLEGHFIVGANLAFLNDLEGGIEHLDEAIHGFETHPYRAGRYRAGNDPRVTSLTTSAIVLWVVGRIDESLRRADRALVVASDLAHPPSLAYARFHSGIIHFLRDEPALLRERAQGVLEVAEAEDLEIWRAVGTCLLGASSAGLGRAEEGLTQVEEGIARYRGLKTPPVFWPLILHVRAWASGRAGRPLDGLPHIDRAIELSRDAGPFVPELYVLRGDLIGGSGGDSSQRVAAYERAFGLAAAAGARTSQLRATTRLTQVAAEDGESGPWSQRLEELFATFVEGQGTAALDDARSALALSDDDPGT